MRPYIKGKAFTECLLLDKLTKHNAKNTNEINEKIKAIKKTFDRFLSPQDKPQPPIILQKQLSLQKTEYS